jgi:polysaccharide biosynthesis protein PslH
LKKILSIVWYKVLPPVFGGQKGIALFNQYLSKHIPLVCLCSGNNEPAGPVPYKIIPGLPIGKMQFINPFYWNIIKSVAKKEQVSHIILEHPYHAIGAYLAKKATGATLILHAHNIESERYRQMGKWWWRLLRSYEKWIHQKADCILFKTETERDYAINKFHLPAGRCLVIPYGIEKKEMPGRLAAGQLIRQRHGINSEEKILLFAGTLDYAPNAKAVECIFSQLLPVLADTDSRYRIIICGRNRYPEYHYLQQLSHPSVIMAGEVKDIDFYFAAADAFINTVQLGGGIQTKNIDALNHHCNLVCFENILDAKTYQVAPGKIFPAATGDWPAFAEQIKRAAGHPGPTPASFFDYYEWPIIVGRLVAHMDAI